MLKSSSLLACLMCLFVLVSAKEERLPSIVFETKLLKCAMYTDYCFMNVLLAPSVNISAFGPAASSSKKIFRYIDIGLCTDTEKSKCPSKQSFESQLNNNQTVDDGYQVYSIHLYPALFGQANLTLIDHEQNTIHSALILVTQPRRWIDYVFDIWIYVFQTIISMIMGILIDVETLLKIKSLYKPVILGVCAQYILMPLLALLSITIFNLPPIQSLTLFIYGCSPGGAASNNWTIMFNGDLELSVILTFVSTCSSLAVMPAWLYTVGSVFMRRANLRIPYTRLAANLLITIGPCLLGILISYFSPKAKAFFEKIAKPFTMIALLSFLVLVFITKWYVFSLFEWKYWLTGPMVPWAGFGLAFLMAYLLKFPMSQAKTISIEAGIQNVGVAFMVILTNFPSPEADYGVLPLMAVAFLTPLPLYGFLLANKIPQWIRKCKGTQVEEKREYEMAPTTEKA